MARFIRTYSDGYLQRHRDTHASHLAFGTHQHPYLHDALRHPAASLTSKLNEQPSLLDYGCGKGVFISEVARLGLFRYIRRPGLG
jgi:2-polyprenyl-3-methyl-5-hydroxy-6-metoxy-1,4-benzoquinol methylase